MCLTITHDQHTCSQGLNKEHWTWWAPMLDSSTKTLGHINRLDHEDAVFSPKTRQSFPWTIQDIHPRGSVLGRAGFENLIALSVLTATRILPTLDFCQFWGLTDGRKSTTNSCFCQILEVWQQEQKVMFAYLRLPAILEVDFGGRHSKAPAIFSQTWQQNLKTKFDSALQPDDHDKQLWQLSYLIAHAFIVLRIFQRLLLRVWNMKVLIIRNSLSERYSCASSKKKAQVRIYLKWHYLR